MAFKWKNEKADEPLLNKVEITPTESKNTGCNLYCSTDKPTCANLSREEINSQQRIPICWESIEELKLDECGCFKKIFEGKENFYNLGECPECGQTFMSSVKRDNCCYEEIKELCRRCK